MALLLDTGLVSGEHETWALEPLLKEYALKDTALLGSAVNSPV